MRRHFLIWIKMSQLGGDKREPVTFECFLFTGALFVRC